MACVNHTARHHSNGYAFPLFSDAYWQLKKAQLESSHSLTSRVNTLAERTVVSPATPAVAADTGSRQELLGRTCWHLLVFGVTLAEVMPVASSELLSESVANTAVTRAMIKQAKCCLRLTPLTEVDLLDKRVQNVKANLLPLRYVWLAMQVSSQQLGHAGHCQGVADDQAESGLGTELNHLFHGRFLRTSSQVMSKT